MMCMDRRGHWRVGSLLAGINKSDDILVSRPASPVLS